MPEDHLNTTSAQKPTELTDAERAELSDRMQAQKLNAERIGFVSANNQVVSDQCLVVDIPSTPDGAVSVCGTKDLLIEEVRRFTNNQGISVDVRCASSAVLEMTDSPVHMHADTLEYYIVRAGRGQMILGNAPDERVVSVKEGSVIVLPPGQAHGVVSDNPDVPIQALLIFTPGLAPKDQPEFRDEQIIFARTSDRLKQLDELSQSDDK